MLRRPASPTLLFPALLLAWAPACLAEAEAAAAIEEIVVTATRREQGLHDVPASLTAFEGGDLEERGIADLVDVGKVVPNLTVTTFAAGHTASANPFVRGIGTQDHLITADPGVAVYVDGVYLGRQVGQHWTLANIERIEVLRGPQGTLYGRNSIGGAINIVTAPPGTNVGRRLAARVGSRERIAASLYADAHVTDALAMTLSAAVQRRGGLGAFRKLPAVGVEVGEIRELSARAALAWRPSPAFSLTIAVDANEGDNGLNPYTTLIDEVPGGAVYAAGYRNADVAADPYDSNTGQADQARTANTAAGVAVTGEWLPHDGLTARVIASARRSDYQAGLDDDGLFDDFLSFPETGEADQTLLEATLLGDYGAIDFVAGVHHFHEQGANVQDPTVFLGSRGTFRLAQRLDSNAAFVSLGRILADRWRISAGMRATRDRKRANTDVGIGPVSARRSWTETSWDLAIRRDIGDRLAAYATVQNGYQSGQFPARPYCLFVDPDCFAAGDNITAVNHEIGLKGRPLDHLELAVALFRTRYHDLPYQVSTTPGEGFNTVNLIVEQRTSGVELEGAFHAGTGLRLRFALGYVDVRAERRGGVRPVAPLTPKVTLSLGPEFRRMLERGGEVAARLDYSWRDRMWGDPSPDAGRGTRIAARGLVDLHLGYTAPGGAWTAGIYARNATDERYDHARLNTGDYVLRILSNDASEFGLRFEVRF